MLFLMVMLSQTSLWCKLPAVELALCGLECATLTPTEGFWWHALLALQRLCVLVADAGTETCSHWARPPIKCCHGVLIPHRHRKKEERHLLENYIPFCPLSSLSMTELSWAMVHKEETHKFSHYMRSVDNTCVDHYSVWRGGFSPWVYTY